MTPTQGPDRSPPVEDLGLTDALVQLSFLVQGVLSRIAAEHGLSIASSESLEYSETMNPECNSWPDISTSTNPVSRDSSTVLNIEGS